MYLRVLALITGILCFSATAQNEPRVIEVNGSGSVFTTPDVLTFSVYIEERGTTASKLNDRVQLKTSQIVNLLEDNGVRTKDIQSMRVNLYPWYERQQQTQIQRGFVLHRYVQVRLRDFEKYSTILDGLLKLGATRIDGFSYQLDDPEDAYLKALDAAVRDAEKRATRIARSLKVKVGGVYSMVEQSDVSAKPVPMMADVALRSRESTNIDADRAGEIVITANVNVEFLIVE